MPITTKKVTLARKEQESPTERPTIENKIGIASAVLVILNIMITVIFGIYQQNSQQEFQATQQARSEDFQKQLISIESQSQLANVILRTAAEPMHEDAFRITNNGFATAKNLRVVICIINLNNIWSVEINDISKFDIATSNSSIKYTHEYTNLNCRFKLTTMINNAILFNIDYLPPNQSISFQINISKDIPTSQKQITLEGFLLAPNSLIDNQSRIMSAFGKFVSSKVSFASFSAEATCENCGVSKEGNPFYELPPSLSISSSLGNYYITDRGAKRSKMSILYVADVDAPEISSELINQTLFLEVLEDSNGFILFQDLGKDFFNFVKP